MAQLTTDLDRVETHVQDVQNVDTYSHNATYKWSWNPAKLIIRTGLFVYQSQITYQLGSSCIYSPSCSEFSRQSFQQFGPAKGLFMSIDRLTRCNRISRPRNGEFELHGDHYHDTPDGYRFQKGL